MTPATLTNFCGRQQVDKSLGQSLLKAEAGRSFPVSQHHRHPLSWIPLPGCPSHARAICSGQRFARRSGLPPVGQAHSPSKAQVKWRTTDPVYGNPRLRGLGPRQTHCHLPGPRGTWGFTRAAPTELNPPAAHWGEYRLDSLPAATTHSPGAGPAAHRAPTTAHLLTGHL